MTRIADILGLTTGRDCHLMPITSWSGEEPACVHRVTTRINSGRRAGSRFVAVISTAMGPESVSWLISPTSVPFVSDCIAGRVC
jgi:hypothetical protein